MVITRFTARPRNKESVATQANAIHLKLKTLKTTTRSTTTNRSVISVNVAHMNPADQAASSRNKGGINPIYAESERPRDGNKEKKWSMCGVE